jgi:hypothetical protein
VNLYFGNYLKIVISEISFPKNIQNSFTEFLKQSKMSFKLSKNIQKCQKKIFCLMVSAKQCLCLTIFDNELVHSFSRGVRHQEIYTFSLGNVKKFQKISGNTCKFQEILGNIRKYYKILGNTMPKTRNTRKYFGIFTRPLFGLSFFIDWVLMFLLFLLGYMKCQLGNTRKYFAKNMKYQKIIILKVS